MIQKFCLKKLKNENRKLENVFNIQFPSLSSEFRYLIIKYNKNWQDYITLKTQIQRNLKI